MIFTRKEMKLILKGKLGKIVSDKIVEKQDWFNTHELVFKINNHYFKITYTEGMYEKPFEWEDNYEADEIAEIIIG